MSTNSKDAVTVKAFDPEKAKKHSKLRRTPSIQHIEATAFLAKIPLGIVGEPGTAKSAIIGKLAEEHGMNLVTVIGSRMAPTDVSGILEKAVIGKDSDGNDIHGTKALINDWQYKMLENPNTVLFFDEFSNTTPSVQASMLNMIQDRELPGGVKIPDDVVIIAAMNPIEQSADGYELSYPTSNRFSWMGWDPEPSLWFDGMEAGFWRDNVSDEELHWKREIVNFLREKGEHLHKVPKDDTIKDNFIANDPVLSSVALYAWPSRRSWDNLSKVLGELTRAKQSNSVVEDQIIRGTVGLDAARDFRQFLATRVKLDIDSLIAKPSSIKWAELSEDDSNILFREAIARMNETPASKEKKITAKERIEGALGVFESAVKANQLDRVAVHFDEFNKTLLNTGKSSDRKAFNARQMKIVTAISAVTSKMK